MSTATTLKLHAAQLSDGTFLISATGANQLPLDPEELSGVLFAWDEKSFYGTFLARNEAGLLLSARDALSFFIDPPWLRHVRYETSESFTAYRSAAMLIQQSLDTGAFLPDFAAWKAGHPGWKFTDVPLEQPDTARRWLSAVIDEMLENRGEVGRAWEQLQTHFPALTVTGAELSPHLPEQEWLQSIGWLPDLTPFRTCLQLLEATEGGDDWILQFFLQDREHPDQLYPIEPSLPISNGIRDELPAAWHAYTDRIYRDLATCTEVMPWLEPEKKGDRFRTRLDNEHAWLFLTTSSLQLVQAGIHVFLPAWWEQVRRTRPRLKAKIKTRAGTSGPSYLGMSQLMDFEWKLALGEVEISEEEFARLLQQKQRLLKISGQWVQLTPDLFMQMQDALKKNRGKNALTLRDVMNIHLRSEPEEQEILDADDDAPYPLAMEVELNRPLQQLFSQLQQVQKIPLLQQPQSFQGTLRNYQLEGSSWLWFLRQFHLGACLADDMGLGKTVQFITYLLYLKDKEEQGPPSLLICPTSVIGNWQKELERFAPSLKIVIHYGNHRRKQEAFLSEIEGADLVITSYALSHLDEQELSRVVWNSICLDEAQNIKNAYTKQASAIRDLRATHRIALTGTPIENRLSELWSIFDFLNPGYLGGLGEFTHRFVQPIERDQNKTLIAQVQRLIQPFLLRRIKTDPSIQLDLPEKNERKEFVPLTAEQGALYETAIQDMFARMETASAMERRGQILATLSRLKQLCDHPALILGDFQSQGEEQRSHKLERLLELIEDIRQKGERCLVFTQYIEMGNMLRRVLVREGYGPVFFLNGSTKKEMRDDMIRRFQDTTRDAEDRATVFILSLRAGGTGLNLTEANHVIHFDRWWNPAVENQATDRAHRIGQKRDVQVYKFISLGTIEERIDEMIERKQSLSQQIVGGSEGWITELSNTELRELFALRHEWMDTRG